nr:sugar ABC transporter permease [uncultured Dorea sp.]
MKSVGKKENPVADFFKTIGRFFQEFGHAVSNGDSGVKASLLLTGAGYWKRHQIIKGILVTLLEIAVILYNIFIGIPYIGKLGTLGTVQQKMVYNPATMKNEVNNYDNSLLCLLFGVISLVFIVVAIALWMENVKVVYSLQKRAEAGKHINTFREDLRELLNGKFHITLLSLPVLGIIIFNVLPLIVMISVAFTNYDQHHMPPAKLFTWVGLENFKSLFTTSMTVTFGYTFRKILVWTLIWAVFATVTTYVGGILLSLLINSKLTKFKKMWRTLFVASIAVPQFVSLLLVRNFFANNGIVNTFLAHTGVTGVLKHLGWISTNYVPFLTDPTWAKVTIIIINIWVGVPYLMLIATGVLMNIPEELKESARIDGANKFQIFKSITMPYMLFITGPYLVTQFTANINNFNVIYLLTQDVYTTTNQKLAASQGKEIDLLVTWLYRLTSEQYNYKMAAVIGICVFIVCAIITLFAFNFLIKGDKEDTFK